MLLCTNCTDKSCLTVQNEAKVLGTNNFFLILKRLVLALYDAMAFEFYF